MNDMDKLNMFNTTTGRIKMDYPTMISDNIKDIIAPKYNLIEILGLPNMYRQIDIGSADTQYVRF